MFLAKKQTGASSLASTYPGGKSQASGQRGQADDSLVFVEIPITFIFSPGLDSEQNKPKATGFKSGLSSTQQVPPLSHPKRYTVELEEDLAFVEKQGSCFNITENLPQPGATANTQTVWNHIQRVPPRAQVSEQSPGPAVRSRQVRAKSGRAELTTSVRDNSKPPSITAYYSSIKTQLEELRSNLTQSRPEYPSVPKVEASPSRRLRLGASGETITSTGTRGAHSAPKNSSMEPENRKRTTAKKPNAAYHLQMSLREGPMPGRRSSGRLGVSGGNLGAPLKASGGTASLLKGLKGEVSRSSSRPSGSKAQNRPASRGFDSQNAAVAAACSILGTGLTQATVIARRSVNKKAFLDQLLDAFPKAPRETTAGNLKRRIRQKCTPKTKPSTEDLSAGPKYHSRSSREPVDNRSSLARLAFRRTEDQAMHHPVSLGLKKWDLRSDRMQGLSSIGFSSRQTETEYPRTSTNSEYATKAVISRSSLLNLSAKLSQETNPSSIISKKKILSSSKCNTPAGRSTKFGTKATASDLGNGSREITKTQPSSAYHNVSGVGLSQHLKPSFSEKQKIMSYLSKNQEDIDLNYNTLMDWEKKKPVSQATSNSNNTSVRRNLLHTTLLRSQVGSTSGYEGNTSTSKKRPAVETTV